MVFAIFDNFLMNIHKSQLMILVQKGTNVLILHHMENREEGALDDRYC